MLLRKLLSDRSGNFATFTAILITALCGFAALVIDISTALARRADSQAAADAAVLTVVQSGATTQSALRFQMEKAFFGNNKERYGSSTKIVDLSMSPDKKLRVVISTHLPLAMGSVLLPEGFQVTLVSEAQKGMGFPVDVALVLDTTLSMKGQKLADLQAASRSLIANFQARAANKARFAIVPFGPYVNVGTAYRKRPWISVPADSSKSETICSTNKPIISQSCRRVTEVRYSDGAPYYTSVSQCTDIVYGPPVTKCSVQTTTLTWSGCVGSRNAPLDESDSSPNIPYTGFLNYVCGQAITPLTSDFNLLNRAIGELYPNGETYIPAGLLWGLNTLTPSEPFAEASTDSRDTRHYMILMTDGDNSMRATYPTHGYDIMGDPANDTLTRDRANKKMLAVCDTAKSKGITVFTVSVGQLLPASIAALTACASDPSKSINIQNSTALLNVFNKFADKIMDTRLTQ